jgi:hypothetical protein
MSSATATPPAKPGYPSSGSPTAQQGSDDKAYIAERGWRDNHDGTWSDMTPPGDGTVEKRMLQEDGRTSKVVKQVLAGPSPGWPHSYKQAVIIERGRNRSPVPAWSVFIAFPAVFPDKEDPRERQERWGVRDAVGTVLRRGDDAITFETKAQAEEWIVKQGK